MGTAQPYVPAGTARIILDTAVPSFAKAGFSGVSMRQIANNAGISVAALYHHFPSKQGLYLAAMSYAFSAEAESITAALGSPGTNRQRFERLIVNFTAMISADDNLRNLIFRELLDGDKDRLKLLATQVFLEPFQAVKELVEHVAPGMDPHLLTISMIGLVLFHFETLALSQHLPGAKDDHRNATTIAKHVVRLILGAP